jgi:hypothetical protein
MKLRRMKNHWKLFAKITIKNILKEKEDLGSS